MDPRGPACARGPITGLFFLFLGNVGMRLRRSGRAWPCLMASLTVGMGIGCGTRDRTPTAEERPFRGLKVTVASVGDPAILATLTAQRGEWEATQGAEVLIRPSSVDPGSIEGVDLLVFRGDRLGDLVDAGVLAVLPESLVAPPAAQEADDPDREPESAGPTPETVDPLRFADVVPAYRDQVTKYGSDRMAFPFGGTALVLAYDHAAFTREENRTAAEREKLTLEPPKTWEQFDALARFFQGRDWDGDGAADHGVALPMGLDPEGLADEVFIARAAALGLHRDQYSFLFNAESMAPRIDSPPFVSALEGLLKLKESGPPGMAGFDAEAARRAFREGKVAMLIDRAELATRWNHGKA